MQHGILVGNQKLQYDCEDKDALRKMTVVADSEFAGDLVPRKKKHDWIGGTDWRAHNENWIHTSELASADCGTILEIHPHGHGDSNESGIPK